MEHGSTECHGLVIPPGLKGHRDHADAGKHSGGSSIPSTTVGASITEHPRGWVAIDICVDQADRESPVGQCNGQVRGQRRLADATFPDATATILVVFPGALKTFFCGP